MPYDQLVTHLNHYLKLEEKEEAILREVFKLRRVKKRQFILQKGDISKSSTFVIEGCFRMYTVDENGKEYNLQFAAENSWINDLESFYKRIPSDKYIESMEPSTILQVSRKELTQLFVHYPKFNRIFRVLTENELVSTQKRILQNISRSAEDRYLDFIAVYPNFLNRISNVQIASFLGITPEFLSIIRKRMINT